LRPFSIVNIVFLAALIVLLWACSAFGISGWWVVVLVLLHAVPLVLGAIYIRWNFYLKSYHQGVSKQWIALTFDDGPAAETEAILDILQAQQVPAAFF
jgi:hypothetical protein